MPVRRIISAVRIRALAAMAVLLVAVPSEAAVRRVLILQSLDRGNLVLDSVSGDFRVEVDQGSPDPVTFTEFVVNPSGLTDSSEAAMVTYLHSIFGNRTKPDLVVTMGGPATAFARKHRNLLFPESPLHLWPSTSCS